MINPEHRISYLIKNGFYFTLYGIVKYLPSPVGDWLRWLFLFPFMGRISTRWIKDGATFWFPERISIGPNTSINEFVYINGFAGVTIGRDVLIGHRCSIVADTHGFSRLDQPIYMQPKPSLPITIGDNVFFGCNVTVLPGVTIGSGAVIGAASVVSEDVPPYAVVVGNPARVVRFRPGAEKQT